MLAGWAFIVIAGAAGIGADATALLAPLVLVPLALALLVLVAGRSVLVLTISTAAAVSFAALGVWNYLRAADFERSHPGWVDATGHDGSLLFVFLALTAAFWSLGSMAWLLRGTRGDAAGFPE
jgi:hypothetical protein